MFLIVQMIEFFFFYSLSRFDSSQEVGKRNFLLIILKKLFLFILFRTIDQANPYFLLQRRRGYDERRGGLANYFAAKLDSVLDNKVNSIEYILR